MASGTRRFARERRAPRRSRNVRGVCEQQCHTQLLAAEFVAASLMDRVARLAGAEKSSSSNLPPPAWETEYVQPLAAACAPTIAKAHEKRVRLGRVADCETGRRLLLKALELGVHNIVGKGESHTEQNGRSEHRRACRRMLAPTWSLGFVLGSLRSLAASDGGCDAERGRNHSEFVGADWSRRSCRR